MGMLGAIKQPHILLDPHATAAGREEQRGLPKGMSAGEAADRIVADLLKGTGPILLVVPGTSGTSYQTSMFETARQAIELSRSSGISIASIPYANSARDIAVRLLTGYPKPEANVLALVLERLKRFAPNRPVYLAGESQGAWQISDTLSRSPELGQAVQRVALFALPGMVIPPSVAVGDAKRGASGIRHWQHTNDIVPTLFTGRMGPALAAFAKAFLDFAKTRDFEFTPHHYDADAAAAARWLVAGVAPSNVVHDSRDH